MDLHQLKNEIVGVRGSEAAAGRRNSPSQVVEKDATEEVAVEKDANEEVAVVSLQALA